MIELLFKHPPDVLLRGSVELAAGWIVYWAVVVLAALAVLGVHARARRRGTLGRRDGVVLAGLRTALFALLAFVLMRPVLVVSDSVRAHGRVVVLLDGSLSMGIADVDGAARADFVRAAFAPGAGTVARALEARFDTRHLRFTGDVAALRDPAGLVFDGPRSDLALALRRAADTVAEGPLAAVVLVTDGGQGPQLGLDGAELALRAAGVPVHTVGVGAPAYPLDLEIDRVELPEPLLLGTTVDAEVVLEHRGLAGASVVLTVEEEGSIVHQEPVVLPEGRVRVALRVPLRFDEPGPRQLTFAVPLQDGETVAANNLRQVIVTVDDEPVPALHFEGEPRFEVRFLRRAVTEDEQVRLVSVVRTADNKYYRLGVAAADELAGGFPASAQELFPFRVLVLGSVEASDLSQAQQALVDEFVVRRGGGLLVLGGSHALAEGGYGNSALRQLLPVTLGRRSLGFRERVSALPTAAGLRHPVLRDLRAADGESGWPSLPRLTVVNPITSAKPGATTLLRGERQGTEPLVVFAHHRYGSGTVAVLAVRDTWRWQMAAPLEDQTHEVFWRRLLRWLARTARERLEVELAPRRAAPGQPVALGARVVDDEYRPLDGLTVSAQVTTPVGDRERVELVADPEAPGTYRASYSPARGGLHELLVRADGVGDEALEVAAVLDVDAQGEEMFDAELDRARLERIAARTGGNYYDRASVSRLPDEIDDVLGGQTVVRRLPLWDMPVLYLLLVALACAEWLLRRRRRLP